MREGAVITMTFCTHCGLLLPAGSTACPRCGAQAPASTPASPLYAQAQRPAGEQPAQQVRYADRKAAHLSTAEYFLMLVVFLIPFLGLIPMLYWSLSETAAPERRHLARAYLIRSVVVSALVLCAAAVFTVAMQVSYNAMMYRYFF